MSSLFTGILDLLPPGVQLWAEMTANSPGMGWLQLSFMMPGGYAVALVPDEET